MRHWATVLFVGLVVAACGGSTTTASTAIPGTTATSAPTTSTTTVSTTTITQVSEDFASLNPPLDRSILSLALEPSDTRPGRFRLERGNNADFLMTVKGRYWVTDRGNVYTALDIDPELVTEQMALLAAAVEATGGQPIDSPYLTSLREHHRGDELQIGLTDLVRSLSVGGLPAEWAEQWSWFTTADGSPVPPELTVCRDAIALLDQAARKWIEHLEIEFADGTWVFPIEDFERSLDEAIEQASICELFVELPGPNPEIVIELSGEQNLRRIEVLVDDKIYTDREPELMFAIVMWPDESLAPPPDEPNPAPLLTLRGTYLTAIGVCKQLPWIYSNFAAGNTYYEPGSGGYGGPTVFSSAWYCQDDVPGQRRNDDQ